MSPDPDFAWLEEIIMGAHADGEVVQAGGVAVVVRRRDVADDDLAVSGPMTISRRADGTLDLVPDGEVETEEGDHPVYARVPPHQLLGVWRDGRWVRAEELPPVAPEPRSP